MKEESVDSLALASWSDLQRPEILWQVVTIAACLLVAWVLAYLLKKKINAHRARYIDRNPERNATRVRTRFKPLDRILFPLLAWLFLVASDGMIRTHGHSFHLVRVVAILALAYVGIHLGLYALRRVFKPTPAAMLVDRWFGIIAWLLVALHVTGLFPDFVSALSGPETSFSIGKNVNISLWQLLSAVFWIGITLVGALGASASLEARLMNAESIDNSMRLVIARFSKAVLIVVAILVAMRLVDIDITVLSVFGGALGVGLGLGLQRIASNYVSGFIILMDRSLRIGDLITVDKYNGNVTAIRTRCTVVRSATGVEALVPNELLLNQPVQNFSYGDKNGSAVTRIRVAYDSDVDHALHIMKMAALDQDRVLHDPGPVVVLKDFGIDGIELELTFFVPDPEAGTDVTRSDINRAIWSGFKAAGIEVPFPQREVRLQSAEAPMTERKKGPSAVLVERA